MHQSKASNDVYNPVLKIWKRDKSGMYYLDYDEITEVLCGLKRSTQEISERLGSERFQETCFGMPIYLFEVQTFEIAIGAYKPLWQKAFERD